jgi:hypothetical protein
VPITQLRPGGESCSQLAASARCSSLWLPAVTIAKRSAISRLQRSITGGGKSS